MTENTQFSYFEEILKPVSAHEFFSSIWERQLYVFRYDRNFNSLLRFDDIQRVLISHPRHAKDADVLMCRMIDGEYSALDVSEHQGYVRVQEVDMLWQAGYTLIVSAVHSRWRPIARFVGQLELELAFRVEANLYCTPPNATGFPPHYDTHDVFVLQLHGEKEWSFFPSRTSLPLPQQRYDLKDQQLHEDLRHKSETLLLKAGDVMYVPRGMVHAASATSSPSLHLSVGLYPLLWIDVLHEIVEMEGLSHAHLRSAVPPGWVNSIDDLEIPVELLTMIKVSPDTWQRSLAAKRRAFLDSWGL